MTVSAAVVESIKVEDEIAVIVEEQVFSFGGVQIATGPLYYNGSSYEIKDDWSITSYDSVYGKNAGSTYFSFTEMGELFEKEGYFIEDDGNIDNLLDPFNGWRLGSVSEWHSIFGTTRSGSTVNDVENVHYALIKLTNTRSGFLVFPDGETISGKSLRVVDGNSISDGMDDITFTSNVTNSELETYLSQGCVFLPVSGYYRSDTSKWVGIDNFCTILNSIEPPAQYHRYKFSWSSVVYGCPEHGADFTNLTDLLQVRLVRTIEQFLHYTKEARKIPGLNFIRNNCYLTRRVARHP